MPKNFLVALPYERIRPDARATSRAPPCASTSCAHNPARDGQLMADWKRLAQPFEREWLAKAKAGVTDPQLGGVPLAARGAAGRPVCPGAQDAHARVGKTLTKNLGQPARADARPVHGPGGDGLRCPPPDRSP